MHYIRFLKTPKVHVEAGSITLRAVITITTDLGETFYQDDIALAATLRSSDPDGDIYLRRTLRWTGGSRSLPISLLLTRTEIEWPAKLQVSLKDTNGISSDCFESFGGPAELPNVISILSEPLSPTQGKFVTSTRVERTFMPMSGRALSIYEDTGDSIARHLWDGSLALAAYIDSVIALQAPISMPLFEHALVSATFRRINVLELGCGCGIVGIALAQSIPDCNVLLTDLPEVDELVERNIEAAHPAISSHLDFAALDWEAPLPPAIQARAFDIVVAAECIYNTDSIPPLVNTMVALVNRSPKTIIIVATKRRHESETLFLDLAMKAGLVQSSKAVLPLPGQPGIGYGDFATEVDLYLYHGKNHRISHSPDVLDTVFELTSGSE